MQQSVPDRAGMGIALAAAGMFGMAVMDACAKFLGGTYAISQIILIRNGIGLLALLAFAGFSSAGLAHLRPRQPGLLLLRSVTGVGAAFLFFTALRYMPLADAFAVSFAAPLFITALSVPVLGERVGPRRWAAVVVGFVGVMIVVRPDPATFRIETLMPLGAALGYAVTMLVGRRMTRSMTTAAIMFWPSVFAVAVAALAMPVQWQTPTAVDLGIFFFMGLVGTLGMSMITQGYRHAPAAVIAPFDYSVLVWGVILGWIIWRDVPAPNVWIGSAILIASGLYIVYRETIVTGPAGPPDQPPGPAR